jgi:G:T-mismatch repair DNA endonuclease (very short patch repair protein)
LGYRFRLNADVPGKPTLYFPSRKLAMFVVSCHSYKHTACGRDKVVFPPYQQREVDLCCRELAAIRGVLAARGIGCEVIWDCEATDADSLKKRLLKILASHSPAG